MVADRATTVIKKSHMGFRLAYLHLTLINCKGQVKVIHISIVNVVNDGICGKYHFVITQKVMLENSIVIFTFDLGPF